jgi:23S rRNA (guanosine2251-2'-O)-methyltransferase
MEKNIKYLGLELSLKLSSRNYRQSLYSKDASSELMKDLMKVMKRNINFSYVPVEKLNRLTPNNHQGAVASISPISFFDLETLIDTVVENGKTPLFLVLDRYQTRNFGAIIRTAECTGVNGIIVQAGSAPVNGDTVKRQQEPYLIFPFVKSIKDAIFASKWN